MPRPVVVPVCLQVKDVLRVREQILETVEEHPSVNFFILDFSGLIWCSQRELDTIMSLYIHPLFMKGGRGFAIVADRDLYVKLARRSLQNVYKSCKEVVKVMAANA